MNGWLKYLVTLLFTLILGAYGYAHVSSMRLEDRLEARLYAIEAKLDRLIEQGR